MDRRTFINTLLGTVASYALMEGLFTSNAFARPIRPITDHWARRLDTISRDLKQGHLAPSQWQEQVAVLFEAVPLEDMLRFIDFERLQQGFTYPDLGVNTRPVRFPRLEGLPENLVYIRKLFGMRRDRAIIPHGHQNMVSCHYVLQGELQLKHYDKLDEDATHMIITPTIDAVARPGSHSSISDERNNIHWLKATTETAFTFDVIVLDLAGAQWHVDNIDPYDAEAIGQNQLRVRKLDVQEALAKYGHDVHH